MESKNFIITEENVEKYSNKIGEWIKEYVANSKANGVVLGMSSGVDCSVVARLCQIAGVNTHLIMLPYGENMNNSKSYSDAMELINKFGFEYHIFDIKSAVDSIEIENINGINKEVINLTRANIRPRVRMTYLYQYARIK